ncbi:hypothetical protein [Catenovulum adriaticum]|uniref:Uncharacterized protein n=1 Tax=Catenovulum adriaticum TaxID=2984846 RepID=A0ABY7AQM6_9ALTE|nr:hypothetical protein [Catenovulum sp. TS8]WAJ71853.1 hypothetical protein OLW01_14080 [Catenovulum sp. TS8]
MRKYLNSSIITGHKSYWATHFCSFFECLHYHTLEESPNKLRNYPNWTLSDYRGHIPNNFFHFLKRWVRNWGFQYFMVNYLNQKVGNYIVEELLDKLSYEFGAHFSRDLDKYWFYVSGGDSKLSDDLSGRFDSIFPKKAGLLPPEMKTVIRNSDLCLVLKNTKENVNVGIFGEVEGNKGYKLTTNTFWNNKSDYCVFAIGVEKGSSKECYIDVFDYNGAPKVNIIFEADHYVVRDFHIVLGAMENLFQNGPRAHFDPLEEEFGFFINRIKMNWDQPVSDIVDFFYKFIDYNDYIGEVDGTLPFMSSIQPD